MLAGGESVSLVVSLATKYARNSLIFKEWRKRVYYQVPEYAGDHRQETS